MIADPHSDPDQHPKLNHF